MSVDKFTFRRKFFVHNFQRCQIWKTHFTSPEGIFIDCHPEMESTFKWNWMVVWHLKFNISHKQLVGDSQGDTFYTTLEWHEWCTSPGFELLMNSWPLSLAKQMLYQLSYWSRSPAHSSWRIGREITDKTQGVRKNILPTGLWCVITNIFPIFDIENHALADVSSWPTVVHHESCSTHMLIIFRLAWT